MSANASRGASLRAEDGYVLDFQSRSRRTRLPGDQIRRVDVAVVERHCRRIRLEVENADVGVVEFAGERDRAVGVGGSSITYRQEATVESTPAGVRVVWPPETRICRLTTECGSEGTWVGPDGDYVAGVSVATNASVA